MAVSVTGAPGGEGRAGTTTGRGPHEQAAMAGGGSRADDDTGGREEGENDGAGRQGDAHW